MCEVMRRDVVLRQAAVSQTTAVRHGNFVSQPLISTPSYSSLQDSSHLNGKITITRLSYTCKDVPALLCSSYLYLFTR